MLNLWNLRRNLRPKIWPTEGQKFSKSKKFKILSEDKKNYNKITTFCKNKQKLTSLVMVTGSPILAPLHKNVYNVFSMYYILSSVKCKVKKLSHQ